MYCKHCKECLREGTEYHNCKKEGMLNLKLDDSFLISTIIGYATDSAILGGLLGGDMTGGIIGDILDGDLFD